MASEPVTILADRIPPMQWSLIVEALARCTNAQVVANDVPTGELRDAIDRLSPDVLILGAPETLSRTGMLDDLIGGASPSRIIALYDGPRLMQLREWRLAVEVLNDVSIETLCAAIEGRC